MRLMDPKLIDKYFSDQCSDEELEKVLDWFQTKEGREFLENDMEMQAAQYGSDDSPHLYKCINSKNLFSRILRSTKNENRKKERFALRVASIIVIVGLLSSLFYWGGYLSTEKTKSDTQVSIVRYTTDASQQKIITLSDGTNIRLNENSTIYVPQTLAHKQRRVELKGEAYFEVISDPDRPFLVHTSGSTIEVLGTKFNVKSDSTSKKVQVAVIEGKVRLKSDEPGNSASAVLTKNNFGMRVSDNQITIDEVNTQNYLSWINNRLVFNGETLSQVSRQLEHLYNIEIEFENDQLKQLKLTANFEKTNLQKVLTTISETFNIQFTINKDEIIWME